MKEKFLATHDLKSRGWTTSMIQKLLPRHDKTRPNELDSRYGDVKLYRESRVLAAESTGAFAELIGKAVEAQERGSKAQQTREQKILSGIDQLVAGFGVEHLRDVLSREQVQALAREEPSRSLELLLWRHHEMDADVYDMDHNHLGKLSRAQRSALRSRLDQKLRELVREAYAWAFGHGGRPPGQGTVV